MRKTVHRLARLAAFVVVGAAVMVPMAVAAADTSIQPLSATLVARGAEVDVTVSFTCPADGRRPRAGERSRTTVSQWTRCSTRLLTGLRCQLQLRLCCVRTGDSADQPLS